MSRCGGRKGKPRLGFSHKFPRGHFGEYVVKRSHRYEPNGAMWFRLASEGGSQVRVPSVRNTLLFNIFRAIKARVLACRDDMPCVISKEFLPLASVNRGDLHKDRWRSLPSSR